MNIWNKKAPIIRSQTLTQLIKSYFKLGEKKKVSIPPWATPLDSSGLVDTGKHCPEL